MSRHNETVLREKTHKGQTDDTHTRVFYTLHGEGEERAGQLQRVTKALSLLIERLEQRQLIDEGDIDDILMGAF